MSSTDKPVSLPNERPRFRAHDWINVNTLKPCYGIQAAVGKAGWMNVSEHGKPLLFPTADARNAALKDMLS